MPVSPSAFEYSYSNIGVSNPPSQTASEYVTMSATTGQALPHVLGLSPKSVYTNSPVKIFATGAGTTAGRYATIVQVQTPSGDWVSVPVQQWTEVAATANAYTPARIIDGPNDKVDPMHQEITINSPDWSSPPHLPVRIVTHLGVDFTDGFHYGFEYATVNVTT